MYWTPESESDLPSRTSPARANRSSSSSGSRPGGAWGTTSPTGTPRLVTAIRSPDWAARRYSLRRFFSVLIPTVFIRTM